MSLDRNAKDPLRIRRDFQRLRNGNGTDAKSLGLTAAYDLLTTTDGSTLSPLHKGTANQILRMSSLGDSFSWVNEFPFTTKGDLVTTSDGTTIIRVGVGSNGQVLTADSTQPGGFKWGTNSVVFPVTTKGDLFTFSTTADRLAIGTQGQVLVSDTAAAVGMSWRSVFPLTTKGDIFTWTTTNARLGVGSQGQVLTVNTAAAAGIDWETPSSGGSPFLNTTLIGANSAISAYPLTIGIQSNTTTGTAFAMFANTVASNPPNVAFFFNPATATGGAGILNIGFQTSTVNKTGSLTTLVSVNSSSSTTTIATTNASIATGGTTTMGTVVMGGGGTITVNGSTTITFNSTTTLNVSGAANVLGNNLTIGTVGKTLAIKEGSNAKMGTATLVAGSATVATTAVAANSRIQLTGNSDGGTPGWVRVSARTAGTSFTITSSSGADTSTVAWVILDPN